MNAVYAILYLRAVCCSSKDAAICHALKENRPFHLLSTLALETPGQIWTVELLFKPYK